ncbi:serine hydrolase domain-containing protein [Hyphococcus luteus]|nr:serine hydrolase domain-containing protein [Marinicaulis flavus]
MSLTALARNAKAALLAAALLLPASAQAQVDPVVPDDPITEDIAVEEAAPAAPDVTPAEDGVHALTKADVDAWLDGFMPYALNENQVVGAVVMVVKDGEILTGRGFGYADLETRKPVDPATTMFRPGSISKLFTWTAVMQLVEKGEIDLDEDVNAYLDFKIPDAFGAPITVRHLMTHTAGFEEAIKNLIFEDPEKLMSLEDYVKSSIPARIFPPGQTPAYSNYATALAGYIVQRVSGESFDDYIDNHIFTPLGMEHSTFRMPLPEKYEGLMSGGYNDAADGEAQKFELIPAGPAGSLSSSGEDMSRFMIAHLNDGGPLLKPETARRMHETIDQHTPPLNAMALGFYQQNRGDLRSVGHGGDTTLFHSDLSLFLDKGVGLFVSFNSSGTGGGMVLLREKLAENFAERYFEEARIPFEPRLDTAKEHGAMVAGLYESSRTPASGFAALMRILGQTTISVDEEGDLVMPLGATQLRWREVEPFIWRNTQMGMRMAAVMDDDGKVDHITFEPVSPFMQYLPTPWHRSSSILMPLLSVALGALVLTLILWPANAIVRWRYKTPFALSGKEALAYRAVRVGIILVFVQLFLWFLIFQTLNSDLTALTAELDGQLRMAQLAQVFLYAALGASVWNLAMVWSGARSWFAKLWSVVLPLAFMVLIWFCAVGGLLSFDLNY